MEKNSGEEYSNEENSSEEKNFFSAYMKIW